MNLQPETAFKLKVQKRLKEIGPSCWFFKTQLLAVMGIPDIIGCFDGRFFAFELKVGKNKLTKLQLYVLKCIEKAGGLALEVTPDNLENAIAQLLRSVNKRIN